MAQYKKSSAVMVFNDKGELALQLRAAKDDSYPSHWDFSAGGGIDLGEDYKVSAERELNEELGVKAEVHYITEIHCQYPMWNSTDLSEVDVVIFKTKYDGPFTPDPKEIDEVRFFTLEEIKDMIESGSKFHPELREAWGKSIVQQAATVL